MEFGERSESLSAVCIGDLGFDSVECELFDLVIFAFCHNLEF